MSNETRGLPQTPEQVDEFINGLVFTGEQVAGQDGELLIPLADAIRALTGLRSRPHTAAGVQPSTTGHSHDLPPVG